MTNQTKNPIFWCAVAFIAGLAIGAWGLIKGDCNSSPNCFEGAGILKWAGGVLIAAGVVGFFTIGNNRRR